MAHSSFREQIAAAVRAEMARQNRTQYQLADLLGLPQPAVSVRCRGERSFRAEELAAVAAWLDVPIAVFMPVPPTPERVA